MYNFSIYYTLSFLPSRLQKIREKICSILCRGVKIFLKFFNFPVLSPSNYRLLGLSIWVFYPVLAGLNPEMYFHIVFNLEMSGIRGKTSRIQAIQISKTNASRWDWSFLSTKLVHDCRHWATLPEQFLCIQLTNLDIVAFFSMINRSVVPAVPFHVWGFLSTILVHDC